MSPGRYSSGPANTSMLTLRRRRIDLSFEGRSIASQCRGGCLFRLGLLRLRRFHVRAPNLRLGYLPLFLPMSPFVFWRLRGFLTYAAFVALLLPSSRPTLRSAWVRLQRAMGAGPSTIVFSMTVSEDDVAQSLALRFGLRMVLRSLVENSVVGAAAALMDDARSAGGKKRRGRGGDRGYGLPLLPRGRADASDALALYPRDYSQQQQQRQGLSSALLSATTFELTKVSFNDGRIILQAEATMPNEEDVAPGMKRRLPFTIRARLEPASSANVRGGLMRQDYHALGFANPDCRLNTNPLTAGTLLGRLIPDVLWIPFGTGVAIPFGRNCRIHRAEIAPDKDCDDHEVFRIDGSLMALATTEDDAWQ
ncbi:hypothetical protein ACHAXA_003876 [Cyclostephanos tholiformis]|uniref:Uncharacterized protein n=1 Tax=Cyclostephanos tholiformis TaxID=382380 RepID=A0ABD3R3L5_9STRA